MEYDIDYIRWKVAQIKQDIKKLYEAEALIQAQCRHPNLKKVAKSNTGNYDPHANCYWYEFKCPDCKKQWEEDQ